MKLTSPGDEVYEGKVRTAQLLIEPDAEVMQGDAGSEARLQAAQHLGAVISEPKLGDQLAVDRLDDLADAG